MIPKSVRLKLKWANDHIDLLENEVKMFLADGPYAWSREVEDPGADGSGKVHVFKWSTYTEPPPELALRAGDAIHNIRSALDHLVVALAHVGAAEQAKVLTQSELRKIAFPVAHNETQFLGTVQRGSLLCVDPMAKAFIEVNQPFRSSPKHPEAHFLSLLAYLDNIDKHRTLNLISWGATISPEWWPSGTKASWLAPLQPLTTPAGITFQGTTDPSYAPTEGEEIGRFIFEGPMAAEETPVRIGWGLAMPIPGRASYELVHFLRNSMYHCQTAVIGPISAQYL